MEKGIVIQGARQNNLKNINLTLPRNKLIVFSGLSGSGKSSLAFDTIYAEGQRKYVESLSAYARQILIKLKAYPLLFPLIRNQQATIRVLQ